MSVGYVVDIKDKEFAKIFSIWEGKVRRNEAVRVNYSDYIVIRDFFHHGECAECKKNSNLYSIRTTDVFTYLNSCTCHCNFRFSSIELTRLIAEYIKKKKTEKLTKLDMECYTIESRGAFSTPTAWDVNKVNNTLKANKLIGGEKSMNINGLIKGVEFGFVKGDKFKLSPLGLAFKNSDNGYSVYDVKRSEMTDVTGMTFNMDNAVMAMPTSIKKIVENDIIMHSNAYVVVKEVKENSLVVVSPFTSEIKEIIPIKNILGFNFYTKLTPLFDMSGAKADEDNPFGSMMPMLLMSQMGEQANGQMNPIMMMAMMNMGKKDKGDEDSFMSKEMMMMMALSGSNGAGANDMLSTMMMMSMFK